MLPVIIAATVGIKSCRIAREYTYIFYLCIHECNYQAWGKVHVKVRI